MTTGEYAELNHLRANPLAMAKARLMVEKRNRAIRSLALLKPSVVFSRLDQERRGGLPAGDDSESVSKSRSHSNPMTDAHDLDIDRQERDYDKALDAIEEAAQLLVGIEKLVGSSHAPTTKERALAMDIGTDCLGCARPIACTPADRSYGGICDACRKAWERAGKPDRPIWLKQRRQALDLTEAS